MLMNYRKIGKRILSLVLVWALSISLLSGCGQGDTAGLAGTAAQNKEAIEKQGEAVQSAGEILTEQTEETKKLVEAVNSAIAKQDASEAASLVEALSDQLAESLPALFKSICRFSG